MDDRGGRLFAFFLVPFAAISCGTTRAQDPADSGNEPLPTIPDGGVQGIFTDIVTTDTGWVAVGEGHGPPALIVTSSDGTNWKWSAPPAGLSTTLSFVGFGNGTILATGNRHGGGTDTIRKVKNGPWELLPLETNQYDIVFGNGQFWMASDQGTGGRVSSDGANWLSTNVSGNVAFIDGEFVAFESNPVKDDAGVVTTLQTTFRTSTDAISWSNPEPLSSPIYSLGVIGDAGDQILGFASDGCVCDPRPNLQLVGTRGRSLSELTITAWPYEDLPVRIVSDGVRVVAASIRAVRVTTLPVDSAPWSEMDFASKGQLLVHVAISKGIIVAAGGDADRRPLIVTSTDGTSWTERRLP
jgi:hypothetical protein